MIRISALCIIIALILDLILALPLRSRAQAAGEVMSFSEAAALLNKSCGHDIVSNCRGVNLDSVRLKECLSRNRDALSPDCARDYRLALEAIQRRISARVRVASACSREIAKLCGGSPGSNNEKVSCLIGQKELSNVCNRAINEAGFR